MSAASHSVIDPVDLTRDLIRIPSVTPADEGAMDVLERALTNLGFACRRMVFEELFLLCCGLQQLRERRRADSGLSGPRELPRHGRRLQLQERRDPLCGDLAEL